jgi:hypothetical protein
MGHKKKKGRARLRGIAVGLAAAAASIIPNVAQAAAPPLPEAIEAEALVARFTRAENALAQAVARADRATLNVFACDCAARVAPLYERAGRSADLLWQARARAIAAAGTEAPRARTPATPPAEVVGVFEKAEMNVEAFEREVAREAMVASSLNAELREIVFARCHEYVSRLEDGCAAGAAESEPPLHMLAVGMAAARAIDEAVLVAAGGSLSRIDTMSEAIAEAVYLDHVFRRGERAPAVNAVFRELAWQRAHLRALRSNA